MEEPVATLDAEIVTCTRCRLSLGRTYAVPGEGPVPADLFFIGEAPGRNEDLLGRPFVGRAGRILDELLASVRLRRDQVFITSIVKCRPPGNRLPRIDEVEACSGYLGRQIALLSPGIIIPMGRLAAEQVFSRFQLQGGAISSIHGKRYPVQAPWGTLLVVPVYHPAVITHNPPLRDTLFEDFRILGTIISDGPGGPPGPL